MSFFSFLYSSLFSGEQCGKTAKYAYTANILIEAYLLIFSNFAPSISSPWSLFPLIVAALLFNNLHFEDLFELGNSSEASCPIYLAILTVYLRRSTDFPQLLFNLNINYRNFRRICVLWGMFEVPGVIRTCAFERIVRNHLSRSPLVRKYKLICLFSANMLI